MLNLAEICDFKNEIAKLSEIHKKQDESIVKLEEQLCKKTKGK